MQLIALGRKKTLHAVVDDEDYERLSCVPWIGQKSGNTWYAGTTVVPDVHRVWMHRLLLGVSDSSIRIDHINHDGLDNRKTNLRILSPQQNRFNARPEIRAACHSCFFGVFRNTSGRKNPWRAGINIDGRYKHLGCFRTEGEAAKAYDEAALRVHGQSVFLNFPLERMHCSLP